MCGPLACAASVDSASGDGTRRGWRTALIWQVGRLYAYALLGGLLGALGGRAVGLLGAAGSPWISLVLAVILLLGLLPERWRAGLGWRRADGVKLVQLGTGGPPGLRAAALGMLTPLLPCGLLHGVLAMAVVAGDAGSGALLMVAFGMGAVPALLLAQSPGASRLMARLPGRLRVWVERGWTVAAAGVLAWRALAPVASGCLASGWHR